MISANTLVDTLLEADPDDPCKDYVLGQSTAGAKPELFYSCLRRLISITLEAAAVTTRSRPLNVIFKNGEAPPVAPAEPYGYWEKLEARFLKDYPGYSFEIHDMRGTPPLNTIWYRPATSGKWGRSSAVKVGRADSDPANAFLNPFDDLVVGIDWLRKQLPDDVETFLEWQGEWEYANVRPADYAASDTIKSFDRYNVDDPVLEGRVHP